MKKTPLRRAVRKVLLIQPNYGWFNKRTWPFPPYTLCLLKASIGKKFDTVVFDPNIDNMPEEDVAAALLKIKPDVVAVTSVSTEYLNATTALTALVRKTLPEAVIIFGGVIPTVLLDESMRDKNVDFWFRGEGEKAFPEFLEALNSGIGDLSDIDGLAYWKDGKPVLQKTKFIEDLDSLPFPDYSCIKSGRNCRKVSLADYGRIRMKYAPGLMARNYPFAVTISSRGCPYRCIFCAGRTVSGSKVRFRSAESILKEIDWLYQQGIREIIFLDDHFLASRQRALDIMQGLLDRKYRLSWKCVNVTSWLLDEKLLQMMRDSGCDLIVVSVESGDPHVLKNIIKKPIDLEKNKEILSLAKSKGFYILVNFVIGFPGETWEQIRRTFRYAETLEADVINFHIATPLPKTELMEICLKQNLLPKDFMENISAYSGYGKGLITTDEFSPFELQVLRSFEWDRINFSCDLRKKNIAFMNGISEEELEEWRKNTRVSTGVNSLVSNIMSYDKSTKNA